MKETLTTQDVIDMASELYDKYFFTRREVKSFLRVLLDHGKANFDLDSVYDLIVG